MNSTRPDDQRAASSAGHASPPTSSTSPARSDPSSSVPSTAGGSIACVTPARVRNPASSAPVRSRTGTITSTAPDSSAVDHSVPKLSKLTDVNCATRAPGPAPNRALLATRFTNPA